MSQQWCTQLICSTMCNDLKGFQLNAPAIDYERKYMPQQLVGSREQSQHTSYKIWRNIQSKKNQNVNQDYIYHSDSKTKADYTNNIQKSLDILDDCEISQNNANYPKLSLTSQNKLRSQRINALKQAKAREFQRSVQMEYTTTKSEKTIPVMTIKLGKNASEQVQKQFNAQGNVITDQQIRNKMLNSQHSSTNNRKLERPYHMKIPTKTQPDSNLSQRILIRSKDSKKNSEK